MIETIDIWLASNLNPSNAKKYNNLPPMLGIIIGIGAYAISGKIIIVIFNS